MSLRARTVLAAVAALSALLIGLLAFLAAAFDSRGGNRLAAWLIVLLGLVGTVVGFIIALGQVNAANASDVNAIGGIVGTLIEGMGVALYTTLVGSVLNLWLAANYQLLATGTANLAAALIDAGHA